MPKSRISLNIHGQNVPDEGRLMDFLHRIDPVAVMVMDNEGLARRIHRELPECITIHRNYGLTKGDDDIHRRISPERWMELRARESDGGLWLYVANEPGFDKDTVTWHVMLMELAAKQDVRLVVGNWSVGTPQAEAWGIARRMLDMINAHPDLFILGLHEYAAGIITSGLYGGYPDNAGVQPGKPGGYNLIAPTAWPQSIEKVTAFHCGRWKFLQKYCQQAGIKTPRIILTEHGMDDASDIGGWLANLKVKNPPYRNVRGYKTLEPQWAEWFPDWSLDRAYCEQLDYADRVYYQHSPVIAQLIYCYGHSSADWESFDIAYASELQDLLAARVATSAPIPAPPPAPVPVPTPAPIPTPDNAAHNYKLTIHLGQLTSEVVQSLSVNLKVEVTEDK